VCTEIADKLSLEAKYTLRDIIEGLRPGDTLVSFNYDTVVESLCHRAGKILFHRSAPDNNVIRFAKPHGSASWDLMPYNQTRIIDLDGEPKRDSLDRNPLDKDAARERRVDPLLLGAVPLKSELISEVAEYYESRRVFDVILGQWRAVADSIRDCDRLVVLGYRFPAEDTYGRFFYREAMIERKQRGAAELQVEYYATCDRVSKEICSALPGVTAPRFMGKVEPAPRLPSPV